MSTSTILACLAMIFVGIPTGLRTTGRRVRVRNPVALTMVVTWFIGQAIYGITKESMPIRALVLFDCAVIAAMFVKEEWISCVYESGWHQLTCLWHERTPWDKAILCLFLVAWLLYTPLFNGDFQYQALWTVGLAQLMLAGWEALDLHLRAAGQKLRAKEERPPGLEFAAWSRRYV